MKKMREVDTNTYIGVLRELLEEGKQVSLVVSGSSMAPFLADHRDTVHLSPVDRPLKRGDIVLYQRKNGQYVLHRIVRVRKNTYDLLGDNQNIVEHGINQNQIIGVVGSVERKGKMIHPGQIQWDFWANGWICVIPFRHTIVQIVTKIRRITKRTN